MRQFLPALTALIVGLTVLLDIFLENPWLDAVGRRLLEGAIVLGAFALILGLVNLFQVHQHRIRRQQQGWHLSAVILSSALVSLLWGLVAWQTPAFAWFYRYLLFPLEASVGALLAFAAVAAAMRVWRLNSLEGTVLLAVGLLVLLGALPLDSGVLARLNPIRAWILEVPVLAAVRGILLGVALGIAATGLRVLFLVDRPYDLKIGREKGSGK